MVFPVVMYRCESWTTKKAEHWRIDAFKEWCWRRHLRVPWTARRSNQSIKGNQSWIFIRRTDAEAEAPILLMWRADSLEKTLMLGKTEGRRRRGWGRDGWMASPAQWTWVWASSRTWWRTGKLGLRQSMGSQRVTEQNQQVWIILNTLSIAFPISKDSEHGEAGRRVEILNDL